MSTPEAVAAKKRSTVTYVLGGVGVAALIVIVALVAAVLVKKKCCPARAPSHVVSYRKPLRASELAEAAAASAGAARLRRDRLGRGHGRNDAGQHGAAASAASSAAAVLSPQTPVPKTPPTCAPVKGAIPKHDRILTWYGVQTDGPLSDGTVTWDMYEANATAIIQYMQNSPLQYTGIMLQLDNPVAGNLNSGKPNNYSVYAFKMAQLISTIPSKYRVGFHVVVESDATWDISFGTPSPSEPQLGRIGGGGGGGCPAPPASRLSSSASLGPLVCTPYDGTPCADTDTSHCWYVKWFNDAPKNLVPQYGAAACQTSPTAPCQPVPGPAPGPGPKPGPGPSPSPSPSPPTATGATISFEGMPTTGPVPPITPAQLPKQLLNRVFHGGAGAAAAPSAVDAAGSPYQAFNAAYSGSASCPYKADPFPPSCPGALSRVAWYIALINYFLRTWFPASKQVVSMTNWDSEGNGPVGLQCSIFQFLYGIRQFGTAQDVRPGPAGSPKWLLFMNGAAGMTNAAANDPSDPCGGWASYPALGPDKKGGNANFTPGGVATLGDMATFQAAPEYYWFNGEDMGAGGGDAPTLLPSLQAAGYKPCKQSAPTKPDYDADCGCRQTVYDAYSRVDDGGVQLLDVFAPIYAKYAPAAGKGGVAPFTPTFSIEHVGGAFSTSGPTGGVTYGTCINAANYCSQLAADNACGLNAKCQVRCGVANFFGNFTEQCFKQFLDAFAQKYRPQSILVYDAGFTPSQWLPSSVVTSPAIVCPNLSPSQLPPGGRCSSVGPGGTDLGPCACPPPNPAQTGVFRRRK